MSIFSCCLFLNLFFYVYHAFDNDLWVTFRVCILSVCSVFAMLWTFLDGITLYYGYQDVNR
jgi:intracellular septation protein A